MGWAAPSGARGEGGNSLRSQQDNYGGNVEQFKMQDRKLILLAILKGHEFNTNGMLRGRKGAESDDLYADTKLDVRTRLRADRPDYVVWSSARPIAWHVPGRGEKVPDIEIGHKVIGYKREHWVVPDVDYGKTVRDHQEIVRVALSFAQMETP